MTDINAAITRMVRDWLKRNSMSQLYIANQLKLSQPNISRRLAGISPWKLTEIDALEAIGAIDLSDFYAAMGVKQ